MVATATLLLFQVPPLELVRVDEAPIQTLATPVMAPGTGLTENVVVAMQPVGKVYDIVAVPEVTPYASPEDRPMVATAALLLVHMPPGVASVKVVVLPGHTAAPPPITSGRALMVTVVIAVQPVVA